MTSFQQQEPLTTRIKGLLEEYPLGTGILKEALQNSDDAGSKTQTFLLDRGTYPSTDLFDPGLKRYQGPSIILQNDTIFQESDFVSLGRIGQSVKKEDVSKTGKFGLGFNSVYNITDAPMILTGDQFIILEPHGEISQPQFRGGFRETFIQQKLPPNQLMPFKSLVPNGFENSFNGTILRLPLRTKDDAARSKISNKEVSPDKILEIFEAFKSEAVESLLFLKSIEKIEVYDLALNTRKPLYSVELLDAHAIRNARSELVKALRNCTVESKAEKSWTMEMKILMTDYSNSKTYQSHWLIRHEINNFRVSIEKEFLKEQKLLPWVGIAAPLNFHNSFSGRLFTFLPLPIITSFPVHIHGIFGLTRDRRNLVQQSADYPKGSKPDIIGKWNKELFQALIPVAWAKLLVDLSKRYNGDDQLPYWPSSTLELQSGVYTDLLANILRRVQEDQLAVFQKCHLSSEKASLKWPSLKVAPKWLSFKDENVLVCGSEDPIAQILVAVGMQIICTSQDILQTLRNKKIPFPELSPSVIRRHLRNTSAQWPSILDAPNKIKLLEYVCNDENFADLVGLELIPLVNNGFATFATSMQKEKFIYLVDSETELDLFQDWNYRLIAPSHKIILDNIEHFQKHTNVQPWNFDAVHQYLYSTFFKLYSSSDDEIPSSAISIDYLNKLWPWIDTKLKDRNAKLDLLWLIPTTQGKLRKVNACPAVISKRAIISPELYGIITGLLNAINAPFLHEGFIENPSGYLKSFGLIKNLNDIPNIFDLLKKRPWQIVSKEEANAIREYFYRCLIAHPVQVSDDAKETLRKLPIFELLVAPKVGRHELVQLSNLVVNAPRKVIAISINSVIPILDNTLLAYTPDPSSEYLVHKVLGIEKKSLDGFLIQVVIPTLSQQPEHLLDPLMEMVLSNLNKIPLDEQKKYLCDLPFVLCSSKINTSCFYRRAPSELVDPNHVGLTKLFFPQENIYPIGFYAERNVIIQLQSLGMLIRINSLLVKSRLNYFVKMWNDESTSNGLKKDIHERSLSLLREIDLSEEPSILEHLQDDVAWLPATTWSGELKLVLSSECRDQRDNDLVSHVLPIVQYKLQNLKLIEFLGWDKDISVDILQKQIFGILDEPHLTQDTALESMLLPVFVYLEKFIINNQSEKLNDLKDALHNRAWIPIKGKLKYITETVFQEPDFSLEPYTTPLPPELKRRAPQFLEYMGVKDSVDNVHMIEILKKISIGSSEANTLLSKEELKLTGRIIEAISYDEKIGPSLREQVLIPNTECRLSKINDITYNDLQSTKTSFTDEEISSYGSMANEIISIGVAKRLRIPLLSERIFYDVIDDDYIKEHEQRESICTRISNTLREYTIESTSNEFIANADDSGATSLKWVYDPYGEYSTESLFCDQMATWQGPSMFCYNNGVFTEDDIKALGKVGIGSKQDDSAKIGRYGLGFLSAYHWTDVPSMVSGDSAVFFDPQQMFLPYKRNSFERFGGVHIKDIGKSKASGFRDQFAPFVGLFGFNPEKYFKGTLFRFPLRDKGQAKKSSIAVNNNYLGEVEVGSLLAEFFRSARQSLFFLHNIKEIEAYFLTKKRELKPLWSVSLEEASSDTLGKRKILTKKSNDLILDICIKKFVNSALGTRMTCTTERWAIFSEVFQIDQSLEDFAKVNRMIPHIGIAAHIWTKSESGIREPSLGLKLFRILSPLPMPICVGLPVHIYGCFALSSDRRSILMDAPNESDKIKISWNSLLLQRTAKLYLRALMQLSKFPDRKGVYYDYWPSSEIKDGYTLIQPLHDEFWKQICDKHEEPNVFETHVLKEGTVFRQWISIGEAIFDDPTDPSTPHIRKILLNDGGHNLVSLPYKLWNILRSSNNKDDMKLVDPALVRKAIKSKRSSNVIIETLGSHILFSNEYSEFLEYLISDNNLEDLINCRILPLNDGSVTKLMYMKDSTEKYYIASAKEQQLFDFAEGQFILENVPPKFVNLLNVFPSMTLNVSPINPAAIGALLHKIIPADQICEYNPFGIQKPNEIWMKAFWEYLDTKIYFLSELRNIPILPVGNPPTHLVSMKYLNESCLLVPEHNDLRGVIEKIGRVHLVYPELLPIKFMTVRKFNLVNYMDCLKKTFHPIKVFKRILNLSELFTETSHAAEICAHLSHEDKIILREFVISQKHTINDEMKDESTALLGNIPIWRAWPNDNLVSARNTYLLEKKLFFPEPPDITILNEKVKHFPLLETLGSRILTNKDYFIECILPSLPKQLSPDEIDRYHTFLGHLFQLYGIPEIVLKHAKIVPDSNGILHCANDLFDSSISLFRDTFSFDGEHKLLHPRFRKYKTVLRGYGLLHKIDNENFIICAKEIERICIHNPSDERLGQAAQVFKYLNKSKLYFFSEDWNQLITINFIPTRLSPDKSFFGSGYYGTERSVYPKVSCLQDLITRDMSNIAWTQLPIYDIAPSRSLRERYNSVYFGFATPSATCVFKHLCCLAKIRKEYTENPNSFLNDLRATYDFLNTAHLSISRKLLSSTSSTTKLFLNYERGNVKPSDLLLDDKFWCCASELVLNTNYDLASNLRKIHSSLNPYRNLLRSAGAKYVYIPKNEEDEKDEDEDKANFRSMLFDKFYDFYQMGIWTDANFLVISPEGKSKIIRGHWNVLAASSDYFRRLLNEPIIERDTNNQIKILGLTPRAVEHAFEFIYSGKLNEDLLNNIVGSNQLQISSGRQKRSLFKEKKKANISSNNPDRDLYYYLLELLQVADRFLLEPMRDSVQIAIIQRDLVRVDTVKHLMENARSYNSKELLKYCRKFKRMNKKLIAKLSQGDNVSEDEDEESQEGDKNDTNEEWDEDEVNQEWKEVEISEEEDEDEVSQEGNEDT